MIHCLHENVVVAWFDSFAFLPVYDEFFAAAKALLLAAFPTRASSHLVRAMATASCCAAPAGLVVGASRVGDLPCPPEVSVEHWAQDWDVHRDDPDNGFAYTPTVHVESRRMRSEGEHDADNGRGDDEQARAEE